MNVLSLLLLAAAADPADGLSKAMLPVYAREAAGYTIAVESAPTAALERKEEPVFEWSNPVRQGLQQGVLYLWLRNGRPAAVGCFFSQPHDKPAGRQVIHELHALDPERLVVTRSRGALNEWKPQAGLARKELAGAPAPAATPGARLIQMRRLAQEFTGYTVDADQKRWDLRVLPAPLYRYPAAKTGVTDGALFALVTSAGTDPEVLLLVEAREVDGKPRWEYACARFSDRDLHVSRGDAEVWALVRDAANTFNNDPLHLYCLYADKVVSPEDGRLLARVRVTEKTRYGAIVPVEDK